MFGYAYENFYVGIWTVSSNKISTSGLKKCSEFCVKVNAFIFSFHKKFLTHSDSHRYLFSFLYLTHRCIRTKIKRRFIINEEVRKNFGALDFVIEPNQRTNKEMNIDLLWQSKSKLSLCIRE